MKIKNPKEDNIFIWSPMISHVGTIKAAIGMGNSFIKHGNKKVFLLNIFGEFNNYKDKNNFILLNVFNNFPFYKTGIISKILIYFFTLLAIPSLFYFTIKYKPKLIITCLVGYIPCILKNFFSDIIIINSIQGYPKINFFRKFIWEKTYFKSDHIITMTNITKSSLSADFQLDKSKVTKIDNPIISSDIRLMANEKIDNKDLEIFKKKVFCSIGRLTRQKNYFELLKGFKLYSTQVNDNVNLIIIGDGEEKNALYKFIKKEKIKNCYLLGFKKNPYKYLAKSSLFISTSSWEEPGHTMIEAGYLNIPVLTSDCPNGPREIIKDSINGFKYKLNDLNSLVAKIAYVDLMSKKDLYKVKTNMKKITSNFTEFKFYKKIISL